MKCKCNVCMHHCALEEGNVGLCKARGNKEGKIVSLNYGKVTAMALDVIEKKPLRRFMPGTRILSVGSFGCNLHCGFCQNAAISMHGEGSVDYQYYEPEMLVEKAQELTLQGNIGLAFTYNEPMVGYEFVRDTARLIHKKSLKNVLVTNGSVCIPILDEVLPYMDAMNIDFKSFSEAGYKSLGGDLETVKAFIQKSAQACHVELTCLIVPGLNDSIAEMEEMAAWIASVNPSIPLHITRFFPAYKMMDAQPTSVSLLYEMVTVAKKSLKYVFVGNV